jgi:hypothetical protein
MQVHFPEEPSSILPLTCQHIFFFALHLLCVWFHSHNGTYHHLNNTIPATIFGSPKNEAFPQWEIKCQTQNPIRKGVWLQTPMTRSIHRFLPRVYDTHAHTMNLLQQIHHPIRDELGITEHGRWFLERLISICISPPYEMLNSDHTAPFQRSCCPHCTTKACLKGGHLMDRRKDRPYPSTKCLRSHFRAVMKTSQINFPTQKLNKAGTKKSFVGIPIY